MRTQEQIEPVLRDAQEAGIRLIRWWTFEGDASAILRDGDGVPIGLKPEVFEDFDAALQLADRYDLFFEFTLFSAPSHIPRGWLVDSGQREQLAAVLAPLFARYRTNPRVFAWDIMNEPDWDIWNKNVEPEPVRELVRTLAAAVHANSRAYVTVGAARLDGLPTWMGLGLDYYQAHWYDQMSQGNQCAMCTSYATVKRRYKLDAPLIIGEFHSNTGDTARERLRAWYDKGYAGALAWSLIPSRTQDRLAVDFGASVHFAQDHAVVGPRLAPDAPLGVNTNRVWP